MSNILIKPTPNFVKRLNPKTYNLQVAELFSDTIQGEGVTMGTPATFLRLKNCTLNCVYCDSKSIWKFGNPYSIGKILNLWRINGIIEKFKNGQSLILTGGSPLFQQRSLIELIKLFIEKFDFKPFIEIENECTLLPDEELIEYIDVWNNSPKLNSSFISFKARYKPEVLEKLSTLKNSWFKFVVSNEDEWDEIEINYLNPKLIKKSQIILMPEGETREALNKSRNIAAEMAIKNNVRYCDRLQIILYDNKKSV